MKIYIALLTIVVSSVAAFGQTKKPVKKPVKPTSKPEIYNAVSIAKLPAQTPAAKKVQLTKLNGDLILGTFLGGNAEFVTIQTNDATVIVEVDEIQWINFGPVRIGTGSIGTAVAPTDATDLTYKGGGNSDQTGMRITGGVLNGKAETLVKPEYPAAARAVRASGAVNVQVTIDEQGVIVSAAAVSGHPLLRQAAEQAARASKFAPTTLEGQPVSVTGIIVYNFVP